MTTSVFDFWGKAERNGPGWHPAVCHMLDTGIVAREILRLQPTAFRQRFVGSLGGDDSLYLNVVALIVALHDIGKVSPGFVAQRMDLCEHLKARGLSFFSTDERDHGRVAMAVLPDIFESILFATQETAEALSYILSAHHGVFDNSEGRNPGDAAWESIRHDAVKLLSRVFAIESLSTVNFQGVSDLFLLGGLISVADWLASDEKTFAYLNGVPSDIDRYVQERTEIATRLIGRLSLGTTVDSEKCFGELFEFDTPNACQQATLEVVAELCHPMLVVVETPMGSGKTEAAQAAYAHVAPRDGLRGMYCAMPTQATGNAMFRRMETFLRRLHDDSTVELHLLHANAGMHKEYDKLKIAAVADRNDTVVASSWFAQRKRGLLAAYGTGTIDQALMAILRVKHFFVRLFGLGGKMIVLDEIHAYSAYMSEEIYNLIGWASRCGSSIVLLSATLPAAKRRRLAEAFSPTVRLLGELEYPCVFGVDLQGTSSYRPVTMPTNDLEMCPVIVDQQTKLRIMADLLIETVGDAGCAACILNTVADAQEMYELLKGHFPDEELILFHSRFTLERRLEIEEEILGKYGKDGKRPRRGVVVASPVLQESLDVCFDAMFSEVAPIDLLLQRAGRLHRHDKNVSNRPLHLAVRKLHVLLPDTQANKTDFGWSSLIYFPDLLCRTCDLFVKDGAYRPLKVRLPQGVPSLIEAVYDDTEESELLDKKRKKWLQERLGTEITDKCYARVAAIMTAREKENDLYYLAGIQNNHEDEATPSTRLGRQRVTLIVLKEGDDVTILDREAERRLFQKSLATDKAALVRHFAAKKLFEPWSESALLRYCQPVFFSNGIAKENELTLAYDRIKGLFIPKDKEGDE